VVTKPTAITPAATVDEELANAMRSDWLDGDGLCVHS